ncbi:hypothetical protein CDV36_014587 [Fusarium kuroshium]|uniref:Amino acid transporter transmembrane domain-containing protein n=1 Tax=Fusarium kuroshium TaxID=2010991 RepID=A0A3M2RHK8_9HYPO|nr:hypothetical protein CDV36_014587 [Fusarium kuroshium]
MSKSTKDQDPPHQLAPAPSQNGEVYDDTAHDAVFGEITEDGPNYRNVGWLGTSALMMKTQIGLGVLSIPAVFDTLGMIPGLICLCTIAAITTWSDWMVGAFKLRHREVYGIADAVLIVTIAVGVQDRPATAPQEGVWVSDYKLFNNPGFLDAISAVSSLVFAYAGTPAFFSIAAEMRDPRLYTRSLILCQSVVTVTYVVIGCVVYYFCGSYVATPALGSAGVTIKKVAYGIAIPGLIVSTTLTIHVPSKYIFVRLLRDSKHLAANTMVHWTTWLGCTFGIAFVAYVIASAIPVFGGLISLVGALLGTLMSVSVIILGTFLMVAGTYGSVVGIIDSYNMDGGSKPFSCADNSGSV